MGLRAVFQPHFRSGREDWDTVAGACGVHLDEDVIVFVSLCMCPFATICACELEPINTYMSACWPYLYACVPTIHVVWPLNART